MRAARGQFHLLPLLWLAVASSALTSPVHASCFSGTAIPALSTLEQRVELEPSDVVRDVQRRLAQSPQDPREIGDLYTIEASAYDMLDDNSAARAATAQARRALEKIPDGQDKAAMAFRLELVDADSPLSNEDMRTSLASLTKLENTVPPRSVSRACLLLVRSRLNIYLMRDEESTADALASQRIAQIMKVPGVAADAAYQLAMSYKDFGLLEDGERLATEAADYHRPNGMAALLSNDLYVRAEIREQMRHYSAALADLAEARALNAQYHQDIDVAFDDEHSCGVLVDLGELDRAREKCASAEPTLRKEDRMDMISLLVDHMAVADMAEHHPAAAVARITPLLAEHEDQIPLRSLLKLYQERAQALSKLGHNEEALRDMREAVRLVGLSAAEEQGLKAERARTRLHDFVILQENASLAAEVEREHAAAAEQENRLLLNRLLAGVALAVCCLVAFIMWSRARRERAQRQQRETLLKEIHHRVKNNLQIISSLLNLQARALGERTVRSFAEASQNRIRSMALVHEHLYQSVTFDRVSMQAYLDRLLQTIADGQDISRFIRYEVSAGQLMLSTEQAGTCGLIVNEVVTNAIKHAFPNGGPGAILVSMTQRDNSLIELIISDNGVGSNPGSVSAPQESFGMRLVEMLVSQLEGTLHVKRDEGTQFQLYFPAMA